MAQQIPTMQERAYTKEELERLHSTLYEILGEIDRVCRENGITYFVIGGTAIGVHFWEGIIPWDDDIDIGMTRANYERFMKIAPRKLNKSYFLQSQDTEPHLPYFFAKVRKNGTMFSESVYKELDIHQGIFIDIFPFDNYAPWPFADRLQYKMMHYMTEVLACKEVWQFTHFGNCTAEQPLHRGYASCLLARILCSCLSKRSIFAMVKAIQTMFNPFRSSEWKNAICLNEHLPKADADSPDIRTFGPLKVPVPRNLVKYLTNHYGKIQKDYPVEKRVTHRPARLSF